MGAEDHGRRRAAKSARISLMELRLRYLRSSATEPSAELGFLTHPQTRRTASDRDRISAGLAKREIGQFPTSGEGSRILPPNMAHQPENIEAHETTSWMPERLWAPVPGELNEKMYPYSFLLRALKGGW